MYKFKRYEHDLTEGEQEQAKFIIKEAKKHTKARMVGVGVTDGLEREAFEGFKRKFYSSVAMRLHLYYADRGCFSLTEDGKKLIYVVVEQG